MNNFHYLLKQQVFLSESQAREREMQEKECAIETSTVVVGLA